MSAADQPAPGSSPAASSDATKVIYIMGAGRSGSTILGVVLGNCFGLFDAGELEAWLRRSGTPNFGGEERIRFWSAVAGEIHDAQELFGDSAWRCLEHSLSLFRVRCWPARRRLRPRYRRVSRDLYRAVTRHSGCSHIVDVSHYPLRARELGRLDGVELYLVYLVRDPHRVVESFKRRDTSQSWKQPLATNVYLWLTHLLCVLTFLRHPRDRRLFVDYDELIDDPERVVPEIMEFAHVPSALPDLSALSTGIPFQGNRLLRTKMLPLERRAPSRAQRQLLLTSLLQWPWNQILARIEPRIHAKPSVRD